MPELWGGVECTMTRIGARRVDQLAATGHDRRPYDLDLIATLGLRSLRYPVLWERVAPQCPDVFDWSWCDERLTRLRQLGMRPIVGLVHHGSGPDWCTLADENFAAGLAEFAARAAARYPWVEDWTPINEPLTTARFCGLYGHWFPHGGDAPTFLRLLLRELDATRLAMAAIRKIIPGARLVQTDDLGQTWSTAPLAYQAQFDNQRRWLGWDLLTGRVGRGHALYRWLRANGVSDAELAGWRASPCPPDLIGVNHYLSSERFLDHRLALYPTVEAGGNGRDTYVDIEAHRALRQGCAGPAGVLRQAWQRYRLPLAVTEAHNGCTRDEQMRWFVEVWHAAATLASQGVPVRAVTAWSLFGASDWSSLLTRADGHYEPGVFDARCDPPRPTAMAGLLRRLAQDEEHDDHPALAAAGWWRRPERLFGLPEHRRAAAAMAAPAASAAPRQRHGTVLSSASATRRLRTRPLIIVGARGTLGRALAAACKARALPCHLFSRAEFDLGRDQTATLARLCPWAIINAAGCVDVDLAERDPERCWRDNFQGVQRLALTCAALDVPLVSFSSDLVFDGTKGAPYDEGDAVAPLSAYGRSKAAAEAALLAAHQGALMVRTSAFFGPHDSANFAMQAWSALRRGCTVDAVADVFISPTYVPDLADHVLDLLIDGESGLWHLANQGALTWHEFARAIARVMGADAGLVRPIAAHRAGWTAPRPRYSALGSQRGHLLPAFDKALARWRVALS